MTPGAGHGGGAADGPPALAFEGVSKTYRTGFFGRRRAALDGVTLAVPRGAFVGLVGSNGSGKSTLLRLAAGVEEPARGRVRVLGIDAERPRARAAIGYLPEGHPWPPELSAAVALTLLLRLAGFDRREARRRSAAALERAGLAGEAHRPLGRCSNGQQRRFGLAQAFAREPELLLLDEPSVALDAEGVEVLVGWLEEARARGASAVIASHLPGDLVGRCERLCVLSRGRVVVDGDTRALAAGATRVEVELELDGPGALARVEAGLPALGARLVAARPTAAGLLALERRGPGAAP